MSLLLLLGLFACAHPVSPEGVALAPRLFDAADLQAGIPQGTRMRFHVTAAGTPTVEQRWEFVRADAAGTTIRSAVYGLDGALIQDEGEAPSTWTELEAHASFPLASTAVAPSRVTVPAGTFATRLYTVDAVGPDGAAQVKRYHFATRFPGPPVLFTIEQGGEEVFRMELVERTVPGAA